jgi:hypothetical protein
MSENQELIARRKRAAHPEFVSTFSREALQARLPLCFPVPETVPPSPKRHYRSEYHYLGYADLACPDHLADLTCFEIALRLIDFSSLRDYLAQAYYAGSAKGQVPFPLWGTYGSIRSPCSCVSACGASWAGAGAAWPNYWPASTAPAGGGCSASETATRPPHQAYATSFTPLVPRCSRNSARS